MPRANSAIAHINKRRRIFAITKVRRNDRVYTAATMTSPSDWRKELLSHFLLIFFVFVF